MTRKLIAPVLFAIATTASVAAAADCLKVDDDNSPEAIVSGRVTKQPIKLPKDSELRATKDFYLKLDPPLRADVGADCRDWNEIAIMPDDRIAKWNNRQVIIAGRLGRFGSALVHPPIFIEISTIKDRMKMKKLLMAVATMATLATGAHAETSVLRFLPKEVQNEITDVRASCSGKRITSGDEGLKRFTFKGLPAILVDFVLRYGRHPFHRNLRMEEGVLDLGAGSCPPQRRPRCIQVHGAVGDHGCPESDRPRAACDAVVLWNGTAFTYDLVGVDARHRR